MAWALSNTIPYTSAADNHTAMVYLFDTVLNGFSNTVVSAHPDASTFKRSIARTTTSLMTGQPYTEYLWVNWVTETPSSLVSQYDDDRYTTVPGDLGTATTNAAIHNLGGLDAGLDWKFWTSDVNPNSVLVTRGKYLFLTAIHPEEGYLYEDPLFVPGGGATARTCVFYATYGTSWRMKGRPNASLATGVETPLIPMHGKASSDKHAAASEAELVIYWGAGILGHDTSSAATPDHSSNVIYPYLQSDVGTAVFNTTSGDARYSGGSGSSGQVIFDSANSRYYYQPVTTTNFTGFVYDMGATEPDMS